MGNSPIHSQGDNPTHHLGAEASLPLEEEAGRLGGQDSQGVVLRSGELAPLGHSVVVVAVRLDAPVDDPTPVAQRSDELGILEGSRSAALALEVEPLPKSRVAGLLALDLHRRLNSNSTFLQRR